MATVSLKLKDPLYKRVRRTSQSLGVSLSAFVREALEERLNQLEQQQVEVKLRQAAQAIASAGESEQEVWGEEVFSLPDEPVWWQEKDAHE